MVPQMDTRRDQRKLLDEQIASEAPLPVPDLGPEAKPRPMEDYLGRRSAHPFAVAGIVENGLVRPLDPLVKLTEHSRVIIVAADVA